MPPGWWRLIMPLRTYVITVILACIVQCSPKHGDPRRSTDVLDGPTFTVHPSDSYVIRNKPAELSCRASHALKVTFNCQGATPSHPAIIDTFVDPRTGIRVIEATLSIEKGLIEKASDSDGVRCHCVAWSSRGVAESDSAQVKIASLRRVFIESPYSRSVGRGTQVELRCIPPDGRPKPTTKWLKNNKVLDIRSNKNYRVSSEGSLLILSAEGSDSANFSCVAENVAGKRYSEVAELKVFVDGHWTTWSPWSACNSDCGPGSRRRLRTCTQPKPQYGGASCQGPAMQKSSCFSACPTVDGFWSSWGSWSNCGVDCRKHRRRSCDDPKPKNGGQFCQGKDLISTNCTSGMCTKVYSGATTGKAMEAALRQDITLIIVLSIMVPVVLILIVFVFRKYNKKAREQGPLYEIAGSEYPMPFCSESKKPYITELTQTKSPAEAFFYNSSTASSNTHHGRTLLYDDEYSTPAHRQDRGRETPASEHLYDMPLARSPIDSPLPAETVHLLPPQLPPGHFVVPKEKSGASSIEKSARSSTPSSAGSGATNSLPSTSCGSEYQDRETPLHVDSFGEIVDAAACAVIGRTGGRLVIANCNVSLTMGSDVTCSEPGRQVYVAVIRKPSNVPILEEKQTLLSPVISCGPPDVVLSKPAVLSFEHSGSLQHAAWKLHVMGRKMGSTAACSQWERIITLGEERVDTPIYTQLDVSQVHLLTETLQQFVLVGESASQNAAVKQLRIIVAAPPPTAAGELCLSVHVVQDTSASLACVQRQERDRRASLLDKPKSLNLQDSGSNLCLTLDEMTSAWKLKTGSHYQEMSFESLWKAKTDAVTTTFIFQRLDESCPTQLSCRVTAQQKGSSINRQVIRINTDFPYAPVTASPAHPKDNTRGMSCLVNENSSFLIPEKVREELCSCLDPPNARGNDWRMLAAQLNVDRYLNYFACKTSPTEHILDLWEARHRDSRALIDLLNVFRVMGRPDAAEILESHSGSWI